MYVDKRKTYLSIMTLGNCTSKFK